MDKLKKPAVIAATIFTTAVVYEIALIGTRAVSEDVNFLIACGKLMKDGKTKKLKKMFK